MADQHRGPQWKPPGTSVPAADKPKDAPRDYITPALAAVKIMGAGPPRLGQESIVAAIIIAQALDRFGEKMIEASAIGNYKRTS